MSAKSLLPIARFLSTPEIVGRAAHRLEWNRARLFEPPIDATWVKSLTAGPELGLGCLACGLMTTRGPVPGWFPANPPPTIHALPATVR